MSNDNILWAIKHYENTLDVTAGLQIAPDGQLIEVIQDDFILQINGIFVEIDGEGDDTFAVVDYVHEPYKKKNYES